MTPSLHLAALSCSLVPLGLASSVFGQSQAMQDAPVGHPEPTTTEIAAGQMTDAEKLGAPAPVQGPQGAAPLSEGPALPGARRTRSKPGPGAGATEWAGETGVAARLVKPLVQANGGDSAWVRGRDYKAGLSADGLWFSAAVGSGGSATVEFQLAAIERGGVPMALESGQPYDTGRALAIDRGAAVEAYSYAMDSVEQTFTFQELVGSGDLVVRMNAKTELAASEDEAGLVFRNKSAEIHYGHAFVLDAGGERESIETRFDGETIELTVPAAYLGAATLPITIDPVINTFVLSVGSADDTKPEAAWDLDRGVYYVVFEDVFSSTDRDIYGFEVSAGGVVDASTFNILDGTSVDTRRPRVAFNNHADQFLVVADGLDLGATNGVIYGIPVDVTPTGLSAGAAFAINDNPGSFHCSGADIAANTFGSSFNSYLVTWVREFSATDTDIHGRIVNSDQTFETDRINIDNSTQYDVQSRVSASLGDFNSLGNYYNVVWVRDDGSSPDGRGEIYSRRVYFDGSSGGPRPPATVLVASGSCYGPVTTSPITDPLPQTGERFCVVAYQRFFSGDNQSSVYAVPVTYGDQVGDEEGISQMEDFDFLLDQVEVDIATDGDGFMMVYSEEFSGIDYDTFYCAGDVQDGPGGSARVTLSERHEALARSVAPERSPILATRFDSGDFGTGTSDDALAVWEELDAGGADMIEGANLDLENNIPVFGDRAVGTQYCRAAMNSDSSKGWVRAMAPSQSIGTRKTVQAFGVTANAFGYLIISNQPGFVPNPGGAIGNLCMLGSGRYVLDVQSSGISGTFSTDMDPSSIPQPTGFTSIASGETWNFQYWHRDLDPGGMLTSNFTNAVSLTFTP